MRRAVCLFRGHDFAYETWRKWCSVCGYTVRGEELYDQPFAKPFQRRCAARCTYPWAGGARCDLRRGHDGVHVAERGLGADIGWAA